MVRSKSKKNDSAGKIEWPQLEQRTGRDVDADNAWGRCEMEPVLHWLAKLLIEHRAEPCQHESFGAEGAAAAP